MRRNILFALLFCSVFLFSCTFSKKTTTLKVAATKIPQTELLNFVKSDLKDQGIDLEVIVIEDYNTPNPLLAERKIDANYFQHIPFLKEQVEEYHYPIEVFAKIDIEPMGVYSKKIQTLSDLKTNSVIVIPNDPVNSSRALLLLDQKGIIRLDNPQNLTSTIKDITFNPKKLQFKEMDSNELVGQLATQEAVIIPTNFALEAKLYPWQDAIAIENSQSLYVNVIAIHKGDEKRKDLLALKKAMTSDKMRNYILQRYKGSVIPVF